MNTEINTEVILDWASKNAIEITPAQLTQLAQHQSMVLETNQQMNLTAITDPTEFATKHIIDSLTILPYIQGAKTLADVGTGAGFPGMVVAIMRPDVQVTLIDSLRKRVFFLQEVVDKLGLANVTAIHARGEELARTGAEYEICTARAVASMDKLAKWVMPLVAPGGIFLAMKGQEVTEELAKAKTALEKKGGLIKAVDVVDISPEISHSIITIQAR